MNIEGKRGGHLIAFDIEKGLLASQGSRRGIAADGPFGDCHVISKNKAVFILRVAGFGGKFDNLAVIEELEWCFCGGGEGVVNLLGEELGGELGIYAAGKPGDGFEEHGVLADLFHFVDFFELDIVAEQCAEFGGEGELIQQKKPASSPGPIWQVLWALMRTSLRCFDEGRR